MTATERALELVRAAAQAASDKLAENIVAFDVSEQLVITDAFLLCSAPNDRQVKAIVDEVEERLREIGAKPVRREGEREGRWVLSTTPTSSCTCSTRRSVPSTPSSGSGATVRSSTCPRPSRPAAA